jgi:hypothetical protein
MQPELLQSYLDTDYILYPDSLSPNFKTIILTINKTNPEINQLLLEIQHTTYLFLTAWNCYSQSQTLSENYSQNENLEKFLKSQKMLFVKALGKSKNSTWEEESFCIFGVDLSKSMEWARKYKQTAFLWGELYAPTQLHWVH